MEARVLLSYKDSFFIKNTKNHFSASDQQEYTKSCFKENAKILSKNSTTQENITISRQNLLFLLKTQKTATIQQVSGEKIPNIILKRMLKFLQKIPPLRKIVEFQNQKKDNETYKMSFTNQKTNKEKMQSFVPT